MKILVKIFFLMQKDSRTRGHEVTLVSDQCRLDIRKYSFSQRTMNEWNKLSTHCVTDSRVNMFKNKVGTYLRRAFLTRFNKIAIQGKGPDGKWTSKPLAYQESNILKRFSVAGVVLLWIRSAVFMPSTSTFMETWSCGEEWETSLQ